MQRRRLQGKQPPPPAWQREGARVAFRTVDDLEAAEALLLAHALVAAPQLRFFDVPGDGNCLYSAVACQLDSGKAGHAELRRASVEYFEERWQKYCAVVPPGTEAAVRAWAAAMRRPMAWGDDLSVRALADYLGRPVVAWRRSSPDQAPSTFVPDPLPSEPVSPIYMLLDETTPGAEHYSALLPTEACGDLEQLLAAARAARGLASAAAVAEAEVPPQSAAAAELEVSQSAVAKSAAKKAAGAKAHAKLCDAPGCCFNTGRPGAPRPGWRPFGETRYREKCLFCKKSHLQEQHARGKQVITKALQAFRAKDKAVHRAAFAKVEKALGKKAAEAYRAKARRPPRKVRLLRKWPELLAQRRPALRPTQQQESQHGRAKALDARRLQKKFPAVVAADGAGKAWMSSRSRAFHKWCVEDAWRVCGSCGRLLPQTFQSKHLQGRGRAGPEAPACPHCKASAGDGPQQGYWAPDPDEQPVPLRRLSSDVIEALRPLQVHTGPAERADHGYAVHTDVIRFSFKIWSVEEALWELPKKERKKGLAAHAFLLASPDSSYKDFALLHNKFLLARGQAIRRGEISFEEPVKRLPVNFLETVGLECAVWPHLYWRTDAAETYVRSTDKRRLRREPGGRLREEEVEEEAEQGGQRWTHQSAKASFLAKARSGLLGYGSDPQLLHFVWDLWMWSSLGGAKNASGIGLREALSSKPFSPERWKTYHMALVDLQAQIGWPSLFITISPYEWSFPYALWLEDELQKCLAARLHAPVGETLHIAHVLTEAIRGLLAGDNEGAKGGKGHIFDVPADAEDRSPSVVHWVLRLEFQDGKRQRNSHRPAQFYHGSGRVHVHALLWLRGMERLPFDEILKAEIPGEERPEMRDLVLGSQLDWDWSGWPAREGPTEYDAAAQTLRLHHPEEAAKKHCRAYLPDLLQSLRCHVDVQASDGKAMLLQYCSSYLPKFSDSFAQEFLQDEASDFAVARRILADYHPLQPEMVLQLAAQQFPQFRAKGMVRKFVCPVPWEKELPTTVQNYMASTWRKPRMNLLDYLRKAGPDGQIQQRYRRLHQRIKTVVALEDWINMTPACGEILVATIVYSRNSDRYFGQWLLLNVPFKNLDDLWDPRAALVPKSLQFLCLCLLKRPDYWSTADGLRAEMALEARTSLSIENAAAQLMSRIELVQAYLSGELLLADHPEPPAPAAAGAAGASVCLAPEQQKILAKIREGVARALQRRWPEDEEGLGPAAWSQWIASGPPPDNPAIAVLGPAGSGKTTAVECAIREAAAKGAYAGIASPTGMLATRYRVKFPGFDVDTVHGMFALHKPELQTLDMMQPYDLVVLDEVGQLSCKTFERLIRLWDAAARRPAVVFVGDFAQLRGIDATTARDSPLWRRVHKLELRTMRRCKCAELRWKLQLLRAHEPDAAQLRRILKGHRAPLHRTDRSQSFEPTLADVKQILKETPKTQFVTFTLRGAQKLNGFAVAALFAGKAPLGELPGDPEHNPDNFGPGRQMWSAYPQRLVVYPGMRLSITKNEDKEHGFVNGMGCAARRLRPSGLEVRADTGDVILIHPITKDYELSDGSSYRLTHFPLRPGYCVNLHKIQGATLEHMTLWLDAPNVPAAAYVALSRVQRDKDWRFVGSLLRLHFRPAPLR